MKVKAKIDQKAILNFLLQHVEKFVFGIVVLVFVLILYSAVGSAKRYDKAPEQLKSKVDEGRRKLAETKPDPSNKELVVNDYVSQAKRSRVPVEEQPYKLTVPIDIPIFATKALRGEPPLLLVEKLQGAAGAGAFQVEKRAEAENRTARRRAGGEMMDEPVRANAGGDVEGRRWVVVTGLVPLEKQEEAFLDTFRHAEGYDSRADLPVYLAYWVQRAEVTSDEDAADPKWGPEIFSRTAVDKALEQWPAKDAGDVVDREYLLEQNPDWLAFPLGPLTNRNWDKNAAHEPEIPLATGERGAGPRGRGELLDEGIAPRRRGGREMMPDMDMPGGGRGGVVKDDPFSKDDTKKTKQVEQAEVEKTNKIEPARKLLRFFDFDVKPGKRYMYRACLAIQNPNYGVKAAYLKKPELGKDKFLKTKWSDPTPVITVAHDTRVLAASVKPARGSSDPSGKVLVIKWSRKTGFDLFYEMEVVRGQVANKNGVEAKVSGGNRTGMGGAAPTSGVMKVNFKSNTTIMDLRGGETLAGRAENAINAPGEVLMLDIDGNLVVRNELDDAAARDEMTAVVTEQQNRGAMDMDMLGPGMDMPPRGNQRKGGLLEGLDAPGGGKKRKAAPAMP